MTKINRFNPFAFLSSVLLDLLLIGMGVVLYYHFEINSVGPIGLSSVVIDLFGSKQLAVLIISGLPVIFGVLGILSTSRRTFTGVSRGAAHQTNAATPNKP